MLLYLLVQLYVCNLALLFRNLTCHFPSAQDEAEGNFKFDGSGSRNSTPPVKSDKRDRDKERLVSDMAAAILGNLDVCY